MVWDPAGEDVKIVVQMQSASDPGFSVASPWLAAGTTTYLHRMTRTFEEHEYRLKVLSGAGNSNVVFHPSTLAPPA